MLSLIVVSDKKGQKTRFYNQKYVFFNGNGDFTCKSISLKVKKCTDKLRFQGRVEFCEITWKEIHKQKMR